MSKSYKNFEKFVSNRLASLRSQKNISAREMSLAIGQGKSYINSIENGKSMPSMQGFFFICEYLEIEPKEFFDTGIGYPAVLSELIQVSKNLDEKALETVLSVAKGLKK